MVLTELSGGARRSAASAAADDAGPEVVAVTQVRLDRRRADANVLLVARIPRRDMAQADLPCSAMTSPVVSVSRERGGDAEREDDEPDGGTRPENYQESFHGHLPNLNDVCWPHCRSE
jgi:hypothetical protein